MIINARLLMLEYKKNTCRLRISGVDLLTGAGYSGISRIIHGFYFVVAVIVTGIFPLS
jgi:hypothetical protein